ncbi:MAG: hypothetical protein ACYS0I_13300, partial [Planctomycetota bacterium]
IVVAVGTVLPGESGFELREVCTGILWFIGALFTWRRKTWAAVLLAVLASYDLIFNYITSVRTLRSDAHDFSLEFDLSESLVFAIGIATYFILTVIMLCIIYYGVIVVVENRNLENGTSNS